MSNLVAYIFPKRLPRLSYFLRSVFFSLATWPAITRYEQGPSDLDALWLFLIIAACVYLMVFIVLPRCRDLDGGWGMALLCLVPIANLIIGWSLLFARSHPVAPDRGEGKDTRLRNPWDESDAKVNRERKDADERKTAQPGATDNPDDAQRN